MSMMKSWPLAVALACSGDKAEDSATPTGDDTQEVHDTSASTDDSADSGSETGDTDTDTDEPDDDSAAEAVEAITAAADEFLDSLGETLRSEVTFGMEDPARRTWSNLPLNMFAREGILTGDLDETQLALFYRLLELSLSSQGYTQALDIIAVDQWHKDNGDDLMGEDLYSMSIFGVPSTTEPWSWQFDGHHLCFTFTIHGDQVSMSPSLWGVNPLTIPDGDIEGLRAMGDEVDTAWALYDSFSADQRGVAVIHPLASPGIFAGPGDDDYTIPAADLGLSVADMSAEQQSLLLSVIETFVLDGQETHAALRMAEIEDSLDELHFAWMGPGEEGAEIYYRVYGPTVLIELDHVNGNDHIHSVYRDPSNDYGEGMLSAHYARYPH